MARRRLDAELVRRGLVSSRTQAQAAVRDGLVRVGGRAATKVSTMVDPADALEIVAVARRFVSRAGDKLDAALDRFGVAVEGRRCLDAGASTGGFTDRLLRGGAAHVVALDVGYGQLAWSLRNDDRVTVLERTNVRDLRREHLPYAPDLITADLSFISLRLAVPVLADVAAEAADLVLLVKPQFEVGRAHVASGGVVRDPNVWAGAIRTVAEACERSGLDVNGIMASPLPGPAGNVEFPLHARKGAARTGFDLAGSIDAALAEGRSLGTVLEQRA